MNEKECTDDVNNDLKEIARDIIEEASLGIVENVESEIDEIENENINQKDFENIKKMLDGSEALLRIIDGADIIENADKNDIIGSERADNTENVIDDEFYLLKENVDAEKDFKIIEKDKDKFDSFNESDKDTENGTDEVSMNENFNTEKDIIENSEENIDSDNDTEKQDTCRICYANDDDEELLAACKCLGTVQYQHESCLLTWLKSGATQCELCHTNYRFKRIVKPYKEVCF